MQGQDSPANQDGVTGKKPWDDPDIPIGQTVIPIDPGGDSPADGTPPPYDGPPGGSGNHGST